MVLNVRDKVKGSREPMDKFCVRFYGPDWEEYPDLAMHRVGIGKAMLHLGRWVSLRDIPSLQETEQDVKWAQCEYASLEVNNG